jgi:hypothetical protein
MTRHHSAPVSPTVLLENLNAGVEIVANIHLIGTTLVTPRWRHDGVASSQGQQPASAAVGLSTIGDGNRNSQVAPPRDAGALLPSSDAGFESCSARLKVTEIRLIQGRIVLGPHEQYYRSPPNPPRTAPTTSNRTAIQDGAA